MKFLGIINQYFKPLILLGSTLTYLLGVGLARYLGFGVDWSAFVYGLGWIGALQIGAFFLYEYFKPAELSDAAQNKNNGRGGRAAPVISRRTVLLVGYACLAVVASLTVLLIAERGSDPVIFLLMVLLFLGGVFYGAPPKLEYSGYGELVLAFLLGLIVPTFAFVLQANQLHRLVAMSTFPLVFIALAMFIALLFPEFTKALRYDRRNLLVRMGWRPAMNLHNLLVLGGYLLLGVASYFGLPSFVVIAGAFSLPFALLEIWQFYRIGQGDPPNWRLLRLNAIATFGGLAYLIAYAYWTH